jgi:hypothetical protein
VDVDAGGRVGEFGDDTGQQRHAEPVQGMRQAVMNGRQRPWIAENDFVDTASGRISTVGGLDIAVEEDTNVGQSGSELAHDLDRLLLDGRGVDLRVVAGNMLQFQAHLVYETAQRDVEGVANIEIFAVSLLQVGRAEAHRKECAAQPLDDVAQSVAGWKLAGARFEGAVLREAPALTCSAQIADDVVKTRESRVRRIG